jgi:dihydrofolate reductase
MMIVSLIGAASENNVIGKDNWMPWDLPAELSYFRNITRGKTVIMGRKTYDTVGRPMPNRHNIIVSRNADLKIPDVDVVGSVEEALELAKKDQLDEIFVIGGEQIYRAAMPYADRIYLSRVHTAIEGGEAFFPEFDEDAWNLVKSERHEVDAENAIPFTKIVYEKKK